MAMDQTSFIVECSVCQQPWEVSWPSSSQPREAHELPRHERLGPASNESMGSCLGTDLPGVVAGEKSVWESDWPKSHGIRPLPDVMDGRTIKLVQA
jgi:hypothetical protein